ncbi:Z1 domain-containing protein [Boudabousia tangfeifanii]|nr:Z1 domain-containing protein [Boudabousia tangfeifanii]
MKRDEVTRDLESGVYNLLIKLEELNELTEAKIDDAIESLSSVYAPYLDESALIAIKHDVKNAIQTKYQFLSLAPIEIVNRDLIINRQFGENNGPFFSNYSNYLSLIKKLNPDAIRNIDIYTKDLVSKLADPNKKSQSVRGLVVADVQSGKTANYIGLIAKALDIGYKTIVVLSGIHNNLRTQTQIRVDEGIIGYSMIKGKENKKVGVGTLKGYKEPNVINPFSSSYADVHEHNKDATIRTDANHVAIVVTKKNVNSLKSLLSHCKSSRLRGPLLVIDDEADNASINVARGKDKTSSINKHIRKLLNEFKVNSYVGYTATPFANVLIDTQKNDLFLGNDIFPKDFITLLRSPQSYFGAIKVFADENDTFLNCCEDIEEYLPTNHQKNTQLNDEIPESLKDAICHFLVNVGIEKLQDNPKHRSMLINVSRFVDVQAKFSNIVRKYLTDVRRHFISFAQLVQSTDDLALFDNDEETFQRFEKVWNHDFVEDHSKFDFINILKSIFSVSHEDEIKVLTVNSTSDDSLDYSGENARFYIAIGGFTLSRGLTLEGLVTSYFARNSKGYDTLMQMCRWFGYREPYEHRCRIWLTPESKGWYQFITSVVEELYAEIDEMSDLELQPDELALKIKKHPGALQVTSPLKMRTATDVLVSLNVSRKVIETVAFLNNEDSLANNRQAVLEILEKLVEKSEESEQSEPSEAQSNNDYQPSNKKLIRYRRDKSPHGLMFENVPFEIILEFLEKYQNDDELSFKSRYEYVSKAIQKMLEEGEAETWDVFIANGSKGKIVDPSLTKLIGDDHSWLIRTAGKYTNSEHIRVGNKQKLSSRGISKVALTHEEINAIEEKKKLEGKAIADSTYLTHTKKPLLVIQPVNLVPAKGLTSEFVGEGVKTFGWSICFPKTNATEACEYTYNWSIPIDNQPEIDEETERVIADD